MAKTTITFQIEERKITDQQQEEKVLSLLVSNPQAYYDVARKIPADHFAFPLNQKIYQAIGTLLANNVQVDAESLTRQLSNESDTFPIHTAIHEARAFETRGEAMAYLQPECIALKRIAIRRKAKDVLENAFRQMSSRLNAESYSPVVEETIQKLQEILTDTGVRSHDSETGIKQTLEYLEQVWAKQTWDRIPTGFIGLDRKIGGFRKKWLTVLGALTSKGKTAWMTTIINNLMHQYKILAFSLEQDAAEIWTRVIAARTSKESAGINSPEFTEYDQQIVRDRAPELQSNTIHLCDERGLNLDELCQEARVIKARHGLDLIFIDYLQLVEVPAKKLKADLGDEREARYKIRTLHKLAKDLNVGVIVFSQFSRSAEDGVPPQVYWLKDSSQIEQSADQIFLIWSALDERGRPNGFAIRIAKHKATERNLILPADIDFNFHYHIPVWTDSKHSLNS